MARDRPFVRSCAAALLLALAAGGAAVPVRAQETAGPVWAFDPAEPGPDRPPVGRSLFDQVFAVERNGVQSIDVPYPFTALRRRLVSHLTPDAEDSAAIAQVLIPLGRALQRNAAAPDYFASPRLVLVVVGNPPAPPGALGTRLKDRLYIGYQEKAESLEVISYNETAGRFEFQIVEDYAPGRRPRVVYARRPVCLACHQNGGPIFSQPPWSETNANAEVARRLAEAAPAFHGVAAEDGSEPFDQALLISTAVVKANLYTAYQRVWRDGCGQAAESSAALRCRAALLTAALQFKLSGNRHFDRQSETYLEDAVAPLGRAWQRIWPAGLAIANALIPNRDPLVEGFDVAAADDPLRARPPIDVWTAEDAGVVEGVVAGLAQLLPATGAARLDRRLRELARDAPRSSQRTLCAVSHRSLEGVGERFLLRCASHEPGGPLLNGHFYLRSQGQLEGGISWLTMGGNEGEEARFEDLAIAGGDLQIGEAGSSLSFAPSNLRGGLSPRLPDGTALEAIALTWASAVEDTADPSAEIPDHPPNGEAELTLAHDFAPVEEAVTDLVRRAEQGESNALTGTAFHGGRAMAAVLAALGAGSDCCGADLPPIALERPPPAPEAGVRQTFAEFCAACHATASPFPPNFLHDGPSDGDGIARCAERIAFRLAMWDRPQAARTKTPMPPESWLRGAGLSPDEWRNGAPRAALRAHLADLLAQAGASAGAVEQRGKEAYEALPSCLAAAE